MQFGWRPPISRNGGLAGPGGPQKICEPACASPASVSVRRPVRDMISWPTTSDNVRGRNLSEADAARLLHARRGEQGCSFAWSLRCHPPSVTLICWPPRTTVMPRPGQPARRLLRWLVLGDLLIIHRHDDVALSEPDIGGGCANRPDRSHDTSVSASRCNSSATAGEIFATFAPWNGERVVRTISLCRYRRGFQPVSSASPFCRALHIDLRRAPSGRVAKGSRRHWDRRLSDRRSRQSRSDDFSRPAPMDCSQPHCDQRARSEAKPQGLGNLRRHRCSRGRAGSLHRLPPLLAEATTTRTMLAGMAKPIPATAGARKDRGVDAGEPPGHVNQSAAELPGLIAASVWMKNW